MSLRDHLGLPKPEEPSKPAGPSKSVEGALRAAELELLEAALALNALGALTAPCGEQLGFALDDLDVAAQELRRERSRERSRAK